MAPIDPTFATSGAEWRFDGIGRIDPVAEPSEGTAGATESQSFGKLLGEQVQNLQKLQQDAAAQAQSLANGTATDTTSVVMAVEKARLSMQLATQLRERGVTALQEILRTQV